VGREASHIRFKHSRGAVVPRIRCRCERQELERLQRSANSPETNFRASCSRWRMTSASFETVVLCSTGSCINRSSRRRRGEWVAPDRHPNSGERRRATRSLERSLPAENHSHGRFLGFGYPLAKMFTPVYWPFIGTRSGRVELAN
jgi:hypothetical protein